MTRSTFLTAPAFFTTAIWSCSSALALVKAIVTSLSLRQLTDVSEGSDKKTWTERELSFWVHPCFPCLLVTAFA